MRLLKVKIQALGTSLEASKMEAYLHRYLLDFLDWKTYIVDWSKGKETLAGKINPANLTTTRDTKNVSKPADSQPAQHSTLGEQ